MFIIAIIEALLEHKSVTVRVYRSELCFNFYYRFVNPATDMVSHEIISTVPGKLPNATKQAPPYLTFGFSDASNITYPTTMGIKEAQSVNARLFVTSAARQKRMTPTKAQAKTKEDMSWAVTDVYPRPYMNVCQHFS